MAPRPAGPRGRPGFSASIPETPTVARHALERRCVAGAGTWWAVGAWSSVSTSCGSGAGFPGGFALRGPALNIIVEGLPCHPVLFLRLRVSDARLKPAVLPVLLDHPALAFLGRLHRGGWPWATTGGPCGSMPRATRNRYASTLVRRVRDADLLGLRVRVYAAGAARCPSCAYRSNARAPERHAVSVWPPQITVIQLETGDDLGSFEPPRAMEWTETILAADRL